MVDKIPNDVFDCEVENLETGLAELKIIVGDKWSKSESTSILEPH